MRRKRLQHDADILCHMFCGWRLIFSKADLVKMGSGVLEIDALTGECTFNGAPTKSLSIANELRLWLAADFEKNNIRIQDVNAARLTVRLEFDEIGWEQRTGGDQFYSFPTGEQIRSETMHRCRMDCDSEIRTTDSVYTCRYNESEEWPIGWPSA